MSKLMLSYLFKTNLAAFRSAILDDNTDKICRFLDIERDYLNKQIDSDGNTALLLAVEYASPLTVRLLLEHGAQPDQVNAITSRTPLISLAYKVHEDHHSYKAQGALEMAKILLDYGAYVDKPSPYVYKDEDDKDYFAKETPLMTAARKKNLPLARLLIERKANVNYIERHSQIRPIHYAIANGDEAMYDLLENAGALCCAIVADGDNTLLHWFCYNKENDEHVSLLMKLIDKGCNIDSKNANEHTPLMLAAKHNMINTCRLLLKNGVDINKSDSHGNQAIDLSVPGSECSKLLLQQVNDQKSESHVQNMPKTQSNNTVVWRQRIDAARQSAAELNNTNHNEIDCQSISSAWSNQEQQTDESSHPYVFPIRRTNSEEMDSKYERIWEKFLQKRNKRLALKSLYKHRASSSDGEDKHPS